MEISEVREERSEERYSAVRDPGVDVALTTLRRVSSHSIDRALLSVYFRRSDLWRCALVFQMIERGAIGIVTSLIRYNHSCLFVILRQKKLFKVNNYQISTG